jgi:hypothetical protein
MKRLAILAALGVTGLVMAVHASAATMPASSTRVGGGSASVLSCDPDGFTASAFGISSGKITSAEVGGIAPACQGGRLSVTLTQGNVSVASGGPVTVTGTSQSVPITGSPDVWNVDGMKAVVLGP